MRRYALATGQARGRREGRLGHRCTFGSPSNGTLPRHRRQRGRAHASCASYDVTAGQAAGAAQAARRRASPAVSFSRSEKRHGVLRSTATARRATSTSTTSAQGAPARLTDVAAARRSTPADLVDTEVVRFKSFDGMAIPNILYKPHQATAERQGARARLGARRPRRADAQAATAPSSSTSSTTATWCWASTTAAAPATARRSSPRTTRSTAASRSGTASRRRSTSRACPTWTRDRIGIIGGSYGGYMVLAALAFQPDEFDVGVDIFGVSNWLRTLESIPPWWEAQREALYQEIGDPATAGGDAARRSRPLFHARQDPQAAARAPGRQRPARHQGRSRTTSSRR